MLIIQTHKKAPISEAHTLDNKTYYSIPTNHSIALRNTSNAAKIMPNYAHFVQGEHEFRPCIDYRSSVLKFSFEKREGCCKILLSSSVMKVLKIPEPYIFCIILSFLLASIPLESMQEKPVELLKITELENGSKLRYCLSLPKHYSATSTYPLVVALHYIGKVTPFFSLEFMASFVEPALEDMDAIMVAPDCPSQGWTDPFSESAILELILLLMKEYKIDADRLVILGYSLGGEGAWYMAARHPDLFSAAIPISAPPFAVTNEIIEHVPIYIIHGEQDERFSFLDVRTSYLEQKKAGAEIRMTIVTNAHHNQLGKFISPLKAAIPWIEKIWESR